MDGVSEKAFSALGQFPIIQASVAIMIMLGGIYMIFKASKDRGAVSQNHTPPWIYSGPVHDTMKTIERIEQYSRSNNELLKDIREAAVACKSALELIRNESRLR